MFDGREDLKIISDRLRSIGDKKLTILERAEEAVNVAKLILKAANKIQTMQEKAIQAKLSRMVDDPAGKQFTVSMTDECFRSQENKRIANQIVHLLELHGVPKFLDFFSRMQLSLFKRIGEPFSFILIPLIKTLIRKETAKVILPGESNQLEKHIDSRRKNGVTTNLNHLGEAILGEEEALKKLEIYCADLEKVSVEYISVKVSTICSQLNLIGWDETLALLKERLRRLYRVAMKNVIYDEKGVGHYKFVNLDMEEYRDLRLTIDLFKSVLDEDEFLGYKGGIVLQAYLPDSFVCLQELIEWSKKRVKRGGAPIKVRLVKGANLAMERVEASLHGWQQAPYLTKIEVDANYRKMLDFATLEQNVKVVNLGVASHNLFDLSYALILLHERKVYEFVNFEMLEGMAEHLRNIMLQLMGKMTLYCPAAEKDDFQHAIAYLIRRLDENTSPDNFLRHAFNLKSESEEFISQSRFFLEGCRLIEKISIIPNRQQNRLQEPVDLKFSEPFANESDTDFSLSVNRQWAGKIFSEYADYQPAEVPLVIGGKLCFTENKKSGVSPNNGEEFFKYNLADEEDIERALAAAEVESKNLSGVNFEERIIILKKAAAIMRRKRSELLKVMIKECGKLLEEADVEISEAIDFCEFYSREMAEILKTEGCKFQPLGVILVTPPWNFPLAIPAGGVAAALVTGNTVILKPAPEAVLTGWHVAQVFYEAGIDQKKLQFIACEDENEGSKLVKDSRLSGCILTGATETAKLFMKMNPDLNLMAETGGKNVIIVSDLSDRDLAIKDIISSAFGHAGQKCSACSLAILEKNVYDDENFLQTLKDAAKSLKVAPSYEPSSRINPLIYPPRGKLLQGLTELDEGEKWLLQPEQDKNNPYLWTPGIKLGVKPGSFSFETEFFGPVLSLVRAESVREAIEMANKTKYGLTGGIHTLDDREKELWLKNICVGNAYVNRGITGAVVRRQPFGGIKHSSVGRGFKAGGSDYLLQLVNIQEVGKFKRSFVQEKFKEFTLLTNLLSDEEKEIFAYSVESYREDYKKYFQARADLSQLIGQENYTVYQPFAKVILLICGDEKKVDIFRVIAAAFICGLPVEVVGSKEIFAELKLDVMGLPGVICRVSAVSNIFAENSAENLVRFRVLGEIPTEWKKLAAEKLLFLATIPVYSIGRFELLHYLRATSVSDNYHRYGNLGKKSQKNI